jgi:hypothetical protein
MAGWSRREVADDARVRMLLELGQVDLAKTFLLATEYRVTEESDDVPNITPEQIEQLRRLGLWRPLDELITKQLADRARSRTARSKRHVSSRVVTRPNVTSREVTDITTQHDTVPSPTEKAKAPAAPRYAFSKEACLKAWNDAITEVTGKPSCVMGMAASTRAQNFHRVVYGNGETFADVVRRRVQLKRELTLHWTANDYAADLQRAAPVKTNGTPGWNDGDMMFGIPKVTA